MLGRAGLNLQIPVYMASGAAGAAFLGQDVQDWTQGKGSVKNTVLHALMVLPAASEVTARFAKARALSTEVAATNRSASQLAEAAKMTRAARTSATQADAPASVMSAIDRNGEELANAVQAAAKGASATSRRSGFVGEGSAVPKDVDQTLQVGLVRDRIAEIARRVDNSTDLADGAAMPLSVRRSLELSRVKTDAAQQTLQQGWRTASKSWDAARSAKAVEDVTVDEAARSEIEAQPAPVVAEAAPAEPEVEEAAADLEEPAKPVRANRDINKIASEPVLKSSTTKESTPDDDPEKPKKGGWWQRRGFF